MMTIHIERVSLPLTSPLIIAALLFSTSACSNPATVNTSNNVPEQKEMQTSKADMQTSDAQVSADKPEFTTKAVATFDEPWAMTALPITDSKAPKLLVTQKTGELFIVDTATGNKSKIEGVPTVAYGGQGGLGDIIVAPDFATSNTVYLSYAEAGTGNDSNKFGAKVIKATLSGLETATPTLQGITPIWQQSPKVTGQGHYSHRLLFSPDGRYLYISSGERQDKDPAQDMSGNLGKIIRLSPDGNAPTDNPFTDNELAKQFWTIGHRNVLGMA
ncbi:MAG: PQQ-dependent sugar dehydrogenase, partial [Psychrobacter nivimaris]